MGEFAGDDADGDVLSEVGFELFAEEDAGDEVWDEVSAGEGDGDANEEDGDG